MDAVNNILMGIYQHFSARLKAFPDGIALGLLRELYYNL